MEKIFENINDNFNENNINRYILITIEDECNITFNNNKINIQSYYSNKLTFKQKNIDAIYRNGKDQVIRFNTLSEKEKENILKQNWKLENLKELK